MVLTRRWWRTVTACALVMGAVACSGSDDDDSGVNNGDNDLDHGGGVSTALPVAAEGEFPFGRSQTLGGRLEVTEDNCWTLDGYLLAFPTGSEIVDDGRAVITPGGDPVTAGSMVDVGAHFVRTELWPGGSDGPWARHAARCRSGAETLVLAVTVDLDPFDPQIVDDEALAALVAGARFESTGGCGFAYTASNDDGTVGIIVSAPFNDYEAASGDLPDDRFSVTVRVGSRLWDQWCTDVIAPFTEPVVAARWPVTAGLFDHQPPAEGTPGVARFVLKDAVLESPVGNIDLGTIVMENSCYDCVPG